MQIILTHDDILHVGAHTGDVHDPVRHVGDISPNSALFTFDHGWIRVDGDCVTVCPYIAGAKGQEHTIDLTVLQRMQSPNIESKVANTQTFRSTSMVNKTDDMVRVTLDMTRNEWRRVKKCIKPTDNKLTEGDDDRSEQVNNL